MGRVSYPVPSGACARPNTSYARKCGKLCHHSPASAMLTTTDGVHVSLSLASASGDLTDWCERLGFTPGRAWIAGERRSTPKGLLLEGLNEHSYCVCELPAASYRLEDVLRIILERFREIPRARLFAATIRLTFEEDSGRTSPPADWVHRLGQAGIKVEVDRYSGQAQR